MPPRQKRLEIADKALNADAVETCESSRASALTENPSVELISLDEGRALSSDNKEVAARDINTSGVPNCAIGRDASGNSPGPEQGTGSSGGPESPARSRVGSMARMCQFLAVAVAHGADFVTIWMGADPQNSCLGYDGSLTTDEDEETLMSDVDTEGSRQCELRDQLSSMDPEGGQYSDMSFRAWTTKDDPDPDADVQPASHTNVGSAAVAAAPAITLLLAAAGTLSAAQDGPSSVPSAAATKASAGRTSKSAQGLLGSNSTPGNPAPTARAATPNVRTRGRVCVFKPAATRIAPPAPAAPAAEQPCACSSCFPAVVQDLVRAVRVALAEKRRLPLSGV